MATEIVGESRPRPAVDLRARHEPDPDPSDEGHWPRPAGEKLTP
jgi:hypothetical protein